MSASGALMQGNSENAAAQAEASQLDTNAGQERAVGQYNAARMREEAKRFMSRQRAGLAGSGFAATDNTAQAIVADTEQKATMEELLALAQSEERANQMNYGATVRRWEGRNAKRAAKVKAGATLLQGLADLSGMMPGRTSGGAGSRGGSPIHVGSHLGPR